MLEIGELQRAVERKYAAWAPIVAPASDGVVGMASSQVLRVDSRRSNRVNRFGYSSSSALLALSSPTVPQVPVLSHKYWHDSFTAGLTKAGMGNRRREATSASR